MRLAATRLVARQFMKQSPQSLLERYLVRISTAYQLGGQSATVTGMGVGVARGKGPKGEAYFLVASAKQVLSPHDTRQMKYTLSRMQGKTPRKAEVPAQVLLLSNSDAGAISFPAEKVFDLSLPAPPLLHFSRIVKSGTAVVMAAYEDTPHGLSLKYYTGQVALAANYFAYQPHLITWDLPTPPCPGAPIAIVHQEEAGARLLAICSPSDMGLQTLTKAVPIQYIHLAVPRNIGKEIEEKKNEWQIEED